MDLITNNKVNIQLNYKKKWICLSDILTGTMVFLYDSQGQLIGKCQYAIDSITFRVPKYDMYVLVLNHPNCQPEVRRIEYNLPVISANETR